jgi:hypothetical protein
MKIFKADNGDVFYNKELEVLKVEEMLKEGSYEIATCKNENGIKSYYDKDNEFIGNAGIHIKDYKSELQDYVYLVKTDESDMEKEVDLDRIFK